MDPSASFNDDQVMSNHVISIAAYPLLDPSLLKVNPRYHILSINILVYISKDNTSFKNIITPKINNNNFKF